MLQEAPYMSMALSLNLSRRVRAGGESFAAPSNVVIVSTDSTPGNRSHQLSFTAPSPVPNSYELQQRVDGATWETASPSSSAGTTYTFSGLGDGIYQYRVRAVYGGGFSPWRISNTLNAFINLYADFSNRYHVIAI